MSAAPQEFINARSGTVARRSIAVPITDSPIN